MLALRNALGLDGGDLKVRLASGAWGYRPVKVWNGSTWVRKPVKVWTGSAWRVTSY